MRINRFLRGILCILFTMALSVAGAESMPAHDLIFRTPNENSEQLCDHAFCYWQMTQGETDEDIVWQVLTQPVTVLKGKEREQCRVLAEPDENCTEYVGCVTYASQGVHVLQTDGDWTLIEAYSSCTEGSKVAVWAERFQGWVRTDLLKEVQVDQHYGVVIDKLQQRLYVYKDGKLFSTLMCSTGFPREDTPFNETPAGEFILVSKVGQITSGQLVCERAMRINDGILIHEVPYIPKVNEETGETTRDYSRCERYLGEKASHGCIRVQKEKTPEGVNAEWLWKNLKNKAPNTKVIIWDEIGRTLGYPDDSYPLYYNPKGGKQYHSSAYCTLVRDKYKPLKEFTWGELEDEKYAGLTRCPGCAPQLRRAEIDTLNEKNTRGK